MVVDTSALVAILQDEPERRALTEAIEAADSRVLSAASWVEASLVVDVRYGAAGLQELDNLIERARITVVPVELEHAQEARRAFRLFGKGRHRAGLNFGDCFAYALARVRGEPLLFKGDDFPHTDVKPAIP